MWSLVLMIVRIPIHCIWNTKPRSLFGQKDENGGNSYQCPYQAFTKNSIKTCTNRTGLYSELFHALWEYEFETSVPETREAGHGGGLYD